jgi:hypothetical protein
VSYSCQECGRGYPGPRHCVCGGNNCMRDDSVDLRADLTRARELLRAVSDQYASVLSSEYSTTRDPHPELTDTALVAVRAFLGEKP